MRLYVQQRRLDKSGTDYRIIGDPTEGALVCLAGKPDYAACINGCI